MPKLWIAHRSPQRRTALARIAGLAAEDVFLGAPRESDFAEASAPSAILLGLEDDFELELDFAHRVRSRVGAARWILLAQTRDTAEAARLFDLVDPEILEPLPTARALRAHLAEAFARRRVESLAARRARQRLADRFSAWLGGIEVPGLLRALDPSLGRLPLLVRGVPGSGRGLLARYVELFRGSKDADDDGRERVGSRATTLRIHAQGIRGPEDLARRVTARAPEGGGEPAMIWIDEVDRLPASAQAALADWILHETTPGDGGGRAPRWIATAGPRRWQDSLEPGLEHAFAPLVIEVPALTDNLQTLPRFVEEVGADWNRSVGGPPRRLSPEALDALAAHPWQGDRSEVEAVLRASFASTRHDPIEVEDLRFDGARTATAEAVSEAPTVETSTTRGPSFEEPDDDEMEPLAVVEAVEEEGETEDLPAASEVDGEQAGEPVAATGADAAPDKGLEPSRVEADESARVRDAAVERARAEGSLAEQGWRRLARSLSHEIRNPLVSIRTFAELLPEHFEDETFRQRFVELVGRDVAHISDVVTRLQSVSEHEVVAAEAVDVSTLIEELLDARRQRIQERRLLVLRELEREAPLAWAEASALRVALAGLIDRALDSLPERGDLFVATRYIEHGSDDRSRLRVLLRHHSPELAPGRSREFEELSPAANVLEYVLAETVARASGGSLTIDSSDAHETLILVDLQTPP